LPTDHNAEKKMETLAQHGNNFTQSSYISKMLFKTKQHPVQKEQVKTPATHISIT